MGIYRGVQKNRHPPKIMIFRQISSLLLNREFSLIYPRYRGKISRGIQIFIRIFATRLYSSQFCCSSLCEKVQNLRVCTPTRINATLFSEKLFGIGFFGWTKHHQIYDSSLFRWPWRALRVIRVGVHTRRFCTFSRKDEQQNRDE